MQSRHACMGCDMRDDDKHDKDCFLLETQEEINRLKEAIRSAIQCLTSGNSNNISDPRPALKYLKEGLNETQEETNQR